MSARHALAGLLAVVLVALAGRPASAQLQADKQIRLVWNLMFGMFTASAALPNEALAADLGIKPGELLVMRVRAGSVAEKAGLRAGDVITAQTDGLWRPGATGELTVRRGDEQLSMTVTTQFHQKMDNLVEPPARAPRQVTVGQGDAEFRTITAALVGAVAGDEILVGPGIYREQILLPSHTTLTGAGAGLTRIESSSPIRINAAENVAMAALTIAPIISPAPPGVVETKSAVAITGSKGVALSDCGIEVAEGFGISASGSTDVSVIGCAFQGTEKAAAISAGASWLSVSRNTFNDFAIAIDVGRGGIAVTDNGFDANLLSVRTNLARSVVRSNAISGANTDKAFCVVVIGCQGRVSGNTIRNCQHGIAMQGAQLAIADNSVSKNKDGMTIYGGHAVITGNAVYGNLNNGIVVTVPDANRPPEHQSATISGNTISLNGRNGIRAKDAKGITVTGNVMEGNVFGLSSSRARLDIARNTIIFQKNSGLFLEDTSVATVERNIVAFNRYGVAVNVDADVALAGNDVYGNLAYKTHPLIDGNYLRLDRVRTGTGDAMRVRVFPAYDLQGDGDTGLEPVFVEPGKDYGLAPGSELAKLADKGGQIGAVAPAGGMSSPASMLKARAEAAADPDPEATCR